MKHVLTSSSVSTTFRTQAKITSSEPAENINFMTSKSTIKTWSVLTIPNYPVKNSGKKEKTHNLPEIATTLSDESGKQSAKTWKE